MLNKADALPQTQICDLGLIDYQEAYFLQKACVEDAVITGKERLLLCEHPVTITLGRTADVRNVLCSLDALADRHIPLHKIDRGGDVTLHAPGQLVAYPILNLRNYRTDLKYYLYYLEQVAIDFLKEFDILAVRISGKTGVWVGEEKIASIGIGIKKWITYHGLAVNVNTDLRHFDLIRPCGLDVATTSVRQLKGVSIDGDSAREKFIGCFQKYFLRNQGGRRE